MLLPWRPAERLAVTYQLDAGAGHHASVHRRDLETTSPRPHRQLRRRDFRPFRSACDPLAASSRRTLCIPFACQICPGFCILCSALRLGVELKEWAYGKTSLFLVGRDLREGCALS